MNRLTATIDRLYNGRTRTAQQFRFVLLAIDLVTIVFFVGLSMTDLKAGWIDVLNYAIAVYLIADLAARASIEEKKLVFFARPLTLADLVVIASLLIAPFVQSFAFLRVLRALRLLKSYHMARDLRARYELFRRHEQIVHAVLNLSVFVFVVSALVLVLQVRSNPQIGDYVDALYYTVTTLTTTGFGDIVLTGTWGRLLAVLIMVVGVALFLRLVQTIFRPQRVKHRCPDCGLTDHDRDAVHCKHCGRLIDIETEGF